MIGPCEQKIQRNLFRITGNGCRLHYIFICCATKFKWRRYVPANPARSTWKSGRWNEQRRIFKRTQRYNAIKWRYVPAVPLNNKEKPYAIEWRDKATHNNKIIGTKCKPVSSSYRPITHRKQAPWTVMRCAQQSLEITLSYKFQFRRDCPCSGHGNDVFLFYVPIYRVAHWHRPVVIVD